MNSFCEVCSSEENTSKTIGKYKCPKCLIKYCGIECWNAHKQTNCMEVSRKAETEFRGTLNASQPILFPTDDTVHPDHLKRLSENENLKSLLKNPALREIIELVDKSKNVKFDIKQAMREPIFVEFADECLSVVEP